MKKKILVVDDEAPIRELLASYLAQHDYEVVPAANGSEARRLIEAEAPQLVILDIVLPDADGMDLLSAARQTHPALPVIMLTGIGFDEELLQEAQQRGADGYVSKLQPLDQLLREVRRVLSGKPAR
jgi:two-component system KDP operon response regulator KdpE